jgi:hypothetical protein
LIALRQAGSPKAAITNVVKPISRGESCDLSRVMAFSQALDGRG